MLVNRKKNICIITSVHSALDDRIFEKQAKSLAKAGYNVILIAPYTHRDIKNDIVIEPIKKYNNRILRIVFGPIIILRKAINFNSDIYHFHDPELIIIGLILKLIGKKIIYDVHEDYPGQILYKKWLKSLFLRQIISFTVKLIQPVIAMQFDAIITARTDISKQFKKSYLIRNLSIINYSDSIKPDNSIKKSIPSIIYAGGLSEVRGIKELIEAISILNGKAELWLLGWWENDNYFKICKESKGWKYTKYFGNVPYKKYFAIMKRADIGAVNFFPIKNHSQTMPNKIFDYMSCFIPLIISDFPYWRNIFYNCAVFINPYDPIDIAQNLNYLLNHTKYASILGDNARQLVINKFSWEEESLKLLNIYKKVLNDNKTIKKN